MVGAPSRRSAKGWWACWLSTTACAALAATVLDSALLQRKWNYFTGGFLSVDYVASWPQGLGFAAGSILTDAAVVGPVIAAVLVALRPLRLRTWLALTFAGIVGVAPLVTADIIGYSVLAYFGDAVDLRLMFDLSGRNLAEFLAVSDKQVMQAGWAALLGLVVATLLAWAAVRASKRGHSAAVFAPVVPRWRHTLAVLLGLVVVASAGMLALRLSSDVIDNGMKRKPSAQLLSVAVSRLSDVDGDGYGLLARISDPAPFDSRIYPYALDIPGNNVDEDGVGGDLPAGLPEYSEPEAPRTTWVRKPNVVLVMLESVRADAVGATLKGATVTPVLDALARSGAVVPAAYSHNGYTVQSRKHTFSGSLAGLRGDTTLIDDFRANGYEVGYFSGQDESFGGVDGEVGFERADVHYDARADVARRYSGSPTPGSLAVPYDVVLEKVQGFLSARRKDKPLFLYVNLHDTHYPYHHPGIRRILDAPVLSQGEIGPGRAADVRAMYLNTVANVDRAIGVLLQQVADAVDGPPAVIVMSDHGESLFDEGFLGHGYDLTDAQTRIPLIVANLPARLEQLMGENDLRDVIARAMTSTDELGRPDVSVTPGREVFQYLGVIDDPVQVGIRWLDGRILYDFRGQRVRADSGPWVRPESLSARDKYRLLHLIRTWERLRLARAANHVDSHGGDPSRAPIR